MKSEVLTCSDFVGLESALIERIDRIKKDDLFKSVAIVVPSNRILSRLRRHLIEKNKSYINLYFFNHRSFAIRIIESKKGVAYQLLDKRFLLAFLRSLIAKKKGSASQYALYFKGALSVLLASINDLREAHVLAQKLNSNLELRAIYTDYCKKITALEVEHGLTDSAGLIDQAIAHSLDNPFFESLDTVIHYGAYDLIQIHQDLLKKIETKLIMMVPGIHSGPAFSYSRSLNSIPQSKKTKLESTGSLLSDRLHLLFNEEDEALQPLKSSCYSIMNAAGAHSELDGAVRRALKFFQQGTALHEIMIVARTLEPYAPFLETVFYKYGLPFNSSIESSLSPLVFNFSLLLKTLLNDFPKDTFMELLRSAFFKKGNINPEKVWPRIEKGGERSWLGINEELTQLVSALVQKKIEWEKANNWLEHTEFLQGLAHDFFEEIPLLSNLSLLDKIREQKPTLSEVFEEVDSLLKESTVPIGSMREEGVLVLDFMKARGLSAKKLIIMGLSSDQWPLKVRQDPFLADSVREKLRKELGVSISVKKNLRAEEHLLIALLLGSVKEHLVLSYQRANEKGQAKAHASLWRELARIIKGHPESRLLLDESFVIPTEPTARVEEELESTGLITGDEALILVGGRAAHPLISVKQLADQFNKRISESGLAYVKTMNAWNPKDLSCDGLIKKEIVKIEHFSPTDIETLSRCPLQYFFKNVLEVKTLEEWVKGPLVEPALIGSITHDVLAEVYKLNKEQLKEIKQVESIFEESFEKKLSLLEPLKTYPLLWKPFIQNWKKSLLAFLTWDLERLRREKHSPEAIEISIKEKITVSTAQGKKEIMIKGRIDRVDRDEEERLHIIDYKTGGKLPGKMRELDYLRGQNLQLPLYVFLMKKVHQRKRIGSMRLMGVGPHFSNPNEDPDSYYPSVEVPQNFEEVWKGIGDALWTLTELATEGKYPMKPSGNSEFEYCSWCSYELACRRSHPPSLNRVKESSIFNVFHELGNRNVSRRKS